MKSKKSVKSNSEGVDFVSERRKIYKWLKYASSIDDKIANV